MYRTLTIAGSDSGGGAGIQADIKTITALGGYAMSVITGLTAQNTLGVAGIHETPPDFIRAQFDAVMGDIGTDAAKTGMLGSPAVVCAVAEKVRQYAIDKLVVDPVMAAKGGAPLISPEGKDALVTQLLPLAFIVTPNLPEAEILAGMKIADVADMEAAAGRIAALGPRCVLIKGGHLPGEPVDILYDGQRFTRFSGRRIDTPNTHGTGCTFSAAIAAGLACGMDIPSAVTQAKAYVETALTFSLSLGSGIGPADHTAWFVREQERYRVITALTEAADLLSERGIAPLIPEVQSNLAYALPGALDPSHVAAFPARIIRCGERTVIPAAPAFGASQHVASIALTVIREHPTFRSAMNVRFSEELISRAADHGLIVSSFSRADEPDDVRVTEGKSLSWGVESVLTRDSVPPDLIFDRGGVGKEPMIRIVGTDPMDVAGKALLLLR